MADVAARVMETVERVQKLLTEWRVPPGSVTAERMFSYSGECLARGGSPIDAEKVVRDTLESSLGPPPADEPPPLEGIV